jgi:hypothetical protein
MPSLTTCGAFITACASALGVGGELIVKESICHRNTALISKSAGEMLEALQSARAKNRSRDDVVNRAAVSQNHDMNLESGSD